MATISNTAEHATEHVKEAASHARARFVELSTQVLRLVNGIREAEGRGADSVLHRLGLQRQTGPLGPALWFAAGAVTAGAAVFVMTTPAGKKLRQDVARFLGREAEVAVEASPVEGAARSEAVAAHAPNGAKP